MVNDHERSGKRRTIQTTADNRRSPATIAKSPFDGLRPGSQANPARARSVPVEMIRDVLDQCPSVEWKLVVGLARFAGLRCPSEIGPPHRTT